MMHVPAKFRENTAMHFRVTVRKLNVTETDGIVQPDRRGAFQYLPSHAFGAAGDNNIINHQNQNNPQGDGTRFCYFDLIYFRTDKNKH